jgi:hypothetical protein
MGYAVENALFQWREGERRVAGTDAATVVDAAFARYAREASNFAGGRPRERHGRPD